MQTKRNLANAEKRYSAPTIENAAAAGYDATGVLSATNEDRTGDTIAVDAYKPWVGKRIPALFAHDHRQIVGVWENLRLQGEKLLGDLRLAATEQGKTVAALIKANVPLANSIGFRGNGKLREDKRGYHFTELELLEASVVAVGAHQDALMIAKSFGVDLTPDASATPPAEFSDLRDAVFKRAAAALQSSLHSIHQETRK